MENSFGGQIVAVCSTINVPSKATFSFGQTSFFRYIKIFGVVYSGKKKKTEKSETTGKYTTK